MLDALDKEDLFSYKTASICVSVMKDANKLPAYLLLTGLSLFLLKFGILSDLSVQFLIDDVENNAIMSVSEHGFRFACVLQCSSHTAQVLAVLRGEE